MPKPREYRSRQLLGPDGRRAVYAPPPIPPGGTIGADDFMGSSSIAFKEAVPAPPAPPGSLYTHIDRWTRRPNRARDNIMRAICALYWLLMAALLSPPSWPLPLILFCWGLVTAATIVLWKGYRRLTRPQPPAPIPFPPRLPLPEKYRTADDLTRHIEDVVAAGEQEAITYGPKPPTRVVR